MTTCLKDPTPDLHAAVRTLDSVGTLIMEGKLLEARHLIDSIDEAPLRELWREKDIILKKLRKIPTFVRGQVERGRPPSQRMRRELYARDFWHCRYCGIEVVDVESRKVMSALLDPLSDRPLFPVGDKGRNAALLCLSASPDHVVAATSFGPSELKNLVTACWLCQFGKLAASLEQLGLADPFLRDPIHTDWDGLTRLLRLPRPKPARSAAPKD